MEKILVTGAGGFIGHHMVRFLKKKGYWVRAVDIKYPDFSSKEEADEFLLSDLRNFENCLKATYGIDKIYHFAANMGGMAFITQKHADILHDSALININIAEAAYQNKVKRLFFSSSACVYPEYRQMDPNNPGLKEEDAYPAAPDTEYGWEKLFTERLFMSYEKDKGLEVRIARYHNIYGPEGTYEGGRQKAPADICRQVALAEDGGEIIIQGDGGQTRSFCYIDDCLEATYFLIESDFNQPLNIGSDQLVSINQLADIVIKISGKKIKKTYQGKYLGVRGRNADLTLARKVLNWEPKVSLEEGLRITYQWIYNELKSKGLIGKLEVRAYG